VLLPVDALELFDAVCMYLCTHCKQALKQAAVDSAALIAQLTTDNAALQCQTSLQAAALKCQQAELITLKAAADAARKWRVSEVCCMYSVYTVYGVFQALARSAGCISSTGYIALQRHKDESQIIAVAAVQQCTTAEQCAYMHPRRVSIARQQCSTSLSFSLCAMCSLCAQKTAARLKYEELQTALAASEQQRVAAVQQLTALQVSSSSIRYYNSC
jgi:hypothetical protein